MKTKTTYFLTGVLTAILIAALTVSAMAADGWTIRVSPIHILVNGEVFQPTDSKGNEVQCFVVNGCTYAPLRALAEAYGLEVGYDSVTNTATVNSSGEQIAAAASILSNSDFASQWEIKEKPVTKYGNEKIFIATYSGNLNMNDFKTWWKSFSPDEIAEGAESLAAEAQWLNPGYTVTMYFSYGTYNLGTAFALGDYEQSNFRAASVWIK